MSHYTVMIDLGSGVDPNDEDAIDSGLLDSLAPFEESLEVEPYKAYWDEEQIWTHLPRLLAKDWLGDVGISSDEPFEAWLAMRAPGLAELPPLERQAVIESNQARLRAIVGSYSSQEIADALNRSRASEYEIDDDREQLLVDSEDGRLYEMSTVNPDGQWDWYALGGRWAGALELTPEAKTRSGSHLMGSLSFGKDAPTYDCDVARKEDVQVNEDLRTLAFIDGAGNWHEMGRVGMFGTMTEPSADWDKTFDSWFSSMPGDHVVAVVDLHR